MGRQEVLKWWERHDHGCGKDCLNSSQQTADLNPRSGGKPQSVSEPSIKEQMKKKVGLAEAAPCMRVTPVIGT